MSRGYIYLGTAAGGLAGSYLPVLFSQGYFSPVSILGGLIGGIAGIWAAAKLSN